MKLKNLLLSGLSLVLVAALAIGGTVAYLQDDDSDVNVMTLGNVKIEQHEYERVVDANGNYATDTIDGVTSYVLKDFTQGKPLLPATELDANGNPYNYGAGGWDDTTVRMSQVGSYGGMQVFTSKNAQDKFVTVENTGKTDAYVRTLVAIEVGSTDGSLIRTSRHFTWDRTEIGKITIDGNNYMLFEYVYRGASDVNRHANGVLPAGDTSYPNLSQVYISAAATNEDMVALDGNGNGTLDILVVSQAVQAADFPNAETALNAGFGDITTNNHPWVDGVKLPTIVSTVAELQTAIDAAVNGDIIVLGADIEGDVTVTQKEGVKFTINGNGYTIEGSITVDGKSQRYETAGITIENVNFSADALSANAYINLGNGDTNTRYTNNVTVKNCTFNYNGTDDKVAIKSYTGGDWNLTVDGCTANAGMHSLVQVSNVEKGLTITNCKANSKNGINLNYTPYLYMSGCEFDTLGYCVRFGVNGATNNGNFTIADSTLTSANDDGDAVIILRGTMTGATLNIEGTTLIGNPDITGTANIVK
jgi:predicted ribosomally synthesized peptide with SipW-like signal peptide